MSCVQDLSIGELALYANGAGNFAIECRAEIARRDSFWADDAREQHFSVTLERGREPRAYVNGQPMEPTRLSGATLAQRLAEVERARDEALANLSACRQERDHWLEVADTKREGPQRPLPDREAIAESIARGLGVLRPEASGLGALGKEFPKYFKAADHVLELLRPYALAQPANELDYRVSTEELGERMQRFAESFTPVDFSREAGWRKMARMVAGLLGVNLRKPDAAAEPAPPAEAADLPASLGTPAPTEPAPFTPTGELVALRAHVERLEQRLAKVEAVAHAPVPVAHADDVELIWTFISRVAELPAFRNTIEAASRAAQLALKHRQTHKVSSDR
jgi:hypothetical protein